MHSLRTASRSAHELRSACNGLIGVRAYVDTSDGSVQLVVGDEPRRKRLRNTPSQRPRAGLDPFAKSVARMLRQGPGLRRAVPPPSQNAHQVEQRQRAAARTVSAKTSRCGPCSLSHLLLATEMVYSVERPSRRRQPRIHEILNPSSRGDVERATIASRDFWYVDPSPSLDKTAHCPLTADAAIAPASLRHHRQSRDGREKCHAAKIRSYIFGVVLATLPPTRSPKAMRPSHRPGGTRSARRQPRLCAYQA